VINPSSRTQKSSLALMYNVLGFELSRGTRTAGSLYTEWHGASTQTPGSSCYNLSDRLHMNKFPQKLQSSHHLTGTALYCGLESQTTVFYEVRKRSKREDVAAAMKFCDAHKSRLLPTSHVKY
jgi:hypothetical protein